MVVLVVHTQDNVKCTSGDESHAEGSVFCGFFMARIWASFIRALKPKRCFP